MYPRLHPPGTLKERWGRRWTVETAGVSLTQQLHYVQITSLLSLVDPTRWLSLCLSPFLSPSLSLCLPPTDYPPNYVSKRNEKMYCVLLNASCVCLCLSSCHSLPLCSYADIAALACYSGQRRKGCVLSTIVFTALFLMSEVQCCLEHTQRLHLSSHTCTQAVLLTESCGEWKLAH